MCRIALLFAAALALSTLLSGQSVMPQSGSARKVRVQVAPEYPRIAKHLNLRGVVKLEVEVRANGSVKSCKVLGGNPVLLEAATKAVAQWKFVPAPSDTVEVVQIAFSGQDD
jgi:TonB family protein